MNKIKAVIFDLDGVLTHTASVHALAWKRAFDPVLRIWANRTDSPFRPFDIAHDYPLFVDGRPRYDGAALFLHSRGIDIPFGSAADLPGTATVCAIANEKNRLYQLLIEEQGAAMDPEMARVVQELRQKNIPMAVATSSKNGRRILQLAGIESAFQTVVDGNSLEQEHLRGKPAPDMFAHAAHQLGFPPDQVAVVEDATVGIQAAVNGGFGAAVGFADNEHSERLLHEAGATTVIHHPAELLRQLDLG